MFWSLPPLVIHYCLYILKNRLVYLHILKVRGNTLCLRLVLRTPFSFPWAIESIEDEVQSNHKYLVPKPPEMEKKRTFIQLCRLFERRNLNLNMKENANLNRTKSFYYNSFSYTVYASNAPYKTFRWRRLVKLCLGWRDNCSTAGNLVNWIHIMFQFTIWKCSNWNTIAQWFISTAAVSSSIV